MMCSLPAVPWEGRRPRPVRPPLPLSYLSEYPIERYMRDLRVVSPAEGGRHAWGPAWAQLTACLRGLLWRSSPHASVAHPGPPCPRTVLLVLSVLTVAAALRAPHPCSTASWRAPTRSCASLSTGAEGAWCSIKEAVLLLAKCLSESAQDQGRRFPSLVCVQGA